VRSVRARAPIAVFVALVLVISAFNYRWHDTWRAKGPLWTKQVHEAALACKTPGRREAQVRSGPKPWYSLVIVPCHVLNPYLTCRDPYCARIDGMADPARRPPDVPAPHRM
jgi:hypothetical protein